MDLLNPSNLATGGIIAAVVAFWSQVRNFFNYVSSLLIVRATLDYNPGVSVVDYLKEHYKKAPTGLLYYKTDTTALRSGEVKPVVYKVLGSTTLFFRWPHFILVSQASGPALKVLAIRGTLDFDDFILKATNAYSTRLESAKSSNYYLYVIMGDEKTNIQHFRSRTQLNAPSSTGVVPSPQGSDSYGYYTQPNPRLDVALGYRTEQLVFKSEDDPLKGLFYDQHILDHIEDAKTWKAAEKWYAERSIPWRRGWLIHGPGGTGKSSLAKVVARTLNVHLYQFMLSTLSDQEFVREWKSMVTPCVVLFEDFDTVFNKREPLTEHRSLTFDCVLNQISGVGALNGVFLIVTTNHLDKIDEAMGVESKFDNQVSTRPGRLDKVIYLGVTSEAVRYQIAQHILKDWPEAHHYLVKKGDGMTAVQFQEVCLDFAFRRIDNQVCSSTTSVPSKNSKELLDEFYQYIDDYGQ
jgi:hypothetical protein